MSNTEQQIYDKLVELSSDWPTIDFDTLDQVAKDVYYTRGIGEADEEWIDGDIICEGDLVDVTIIWDSRRQEAELIVEPYQEF